MGKVCDISASTWYEDSTDPAVGLHVPDGPFYMEDVQPTALPRPGHPLPHVQVVPDDSADDSTERTTKLFPECMH